MEIKYWTFGLFFSIVIGGAVTGVFLYTLRVVLELGEKPKPKGKSIKRAPPWLTGAVERMVFTVLVAEGVGGAATAMMGWLALKLATNWNRDDWKNDPKARPFAFTALLAGLLSMLFAALGGLVASSKLWAGFIASI